MRKAEKRRSHSCKKKKEKKVLCNRKNRRPCTRRGKLSPEKFSVHPVKIFFFVSYRRWLGCFESGGNDDDTSRDDTDAKFFGGKRRISRKEKKNGKK